MIAVRPAHRRHRHSADGPRGDTGAGAPALGWRDSVLKRAGRASASAPASPANLRASSVRRKSNRTSPSGTTGTTRGTPLHRHLRGAPGSEHFSRRVPGRRIAVRNRRTYRPPDSASTDHGRRDGDVALFSHGQFGAVFGARWIGLPVFEAQHFTVGPASMSALSWNLDHPEIPVIALWNATAVADAPTVPAL